MVDTAGQYALDHGISRADAIRALNDIYAYNHRNDTFAAAHPTEALADQQMFARFDAGTAGNQVVKGEVSIVPISGQLTPGRATPNPVYDTYGANKSAQLRQNAVTQGLVESGRYVSPYPAKGARVEGPVAPSVVSLFTGQTAPTDVSGGVAQKLSAGSQNPQSIRGDVSYGVSVPVQSRKVYNLQSPSQTIEEKQRNDTIRRTNSSPNNNNSISNSNILLGQKSGFEKRVEQIQEREKQFSQLPYLQEIEARKNLVGNNPFAQVESNVVSSIFELPVTLPAEAYFTGMKLAAVGEGLFFSPRETLKELFFTAPKEVEKGAFSFLPGGTPINPEGATTLIFAGIGASEFALEPGAIEKSPLRVRDFGVVDSKSPVSLKVVSVEVGSKSQPLISFEPAAAENPVNVLRDMFGSKSTLSGRSRTGVVFGTPDVSQSLIDLKSTGLNGEGVRPGNPTETKILQNGLNNIPESSFASPTRARSLIPVQQSLIRGSQGLQSNFIGDFSKTTSGLDERGVQLALDITRENQGKLSGSFGRTAQLAKEFNIDGKIFKLDKVSGDIDIHLDNKSPAEIQLIAKNSLERFKGLGYDAKLKGEGGIVQNAILIKQPSGVYVKAIEFLGKGTLAEADIPPDMVIGFKKEGKAINISGVQSTSLAEELRGTIQGGTRIRKLDNGLLDIYPREGRAKDIGSTSVAARTLVDSKLFKGRYLENIKKFESLYPESLTRSQLALAGGASSKLLVADFSGSGNPSVNSGVGSNIFLSPLFFKKEVNKISPSVNSGFGNNEELSSSNFSGASNINNSNFSLKSLSKSSSVVPSGASSSSLFPSVSRVASPRSSSSPSGLSSGSSPSSVFPSQKVSPSNSISPISSPSGSSSRSPLSKKSSSPSSISQLPRYTEQNKRVFPTFFKRQELNDFGVSVRRQGVFREVGKGLPLFEAIKLGKSRVHNTAAASFEVTQGGRPFRISAPAGFYSKGNILIEPRELRIKSRGELSEITFKGIEANRKKSSRIGLSI